MELWSKENGQSVKDFLPVLETLIGTTDDPRKEIGEE